MPVPQRFYETILLDDGGWDAGIISVPGIVGNIGEIPAIERAWELGLEPLPVANVSANIAVEVKRASVRSSVPYEWWTAPVVIIESSDPVGRALSNLVTMAGGGVLVELGASTAVLVVYGTAWALAWLLSPAMEGAREAVRDEARERTAAWLRRHRSSQ